MRKAVIILLVVVAIVVAAALVLPAVVDVNRYRPQIEAQLEERLGRDVSLGEMRLSLAPPAFRVDNATIAEDPRFQTGRPFAQTETLYVRPELWPLFHGKIVVDSLQLRHPKLELVRAADGSWNFMTLVSPQDQKEGESAGRFTLDELKIYDGQVAITDLKQGEARSVYDHIDLALEDYAPAQAFHLRLAAHLPGPGTQQARFEGKIGPLPEGGLARTPVRGKFEMEEVSVSGLERFLSTKALGDSDAVLSGNAEITSDQGQLASQGNLKAVNARILGTEISYPISADYRLSGNLEQETVEIESADLRLGSTPVAVEGTVNFAPSPMQADLRVKASDISLSEAAQLASAFGVAFQAGTDVEGKLSINVRASGPVNRPSLSGEVSARDVSIRGGDLKQPVAVNAVQLTLEPQAIRSNEFTARSGGTSLGAQFTLSGYSGDSPRIQAKLHAGESEVGDLLSIAQAYGVEAAEGMSGSGKAQIDLTVQGPVKQTEKLSYSGQGSLRNASLVVPALTKPLEVRQASMRFSSNSLVLENLDLSLGQTSMRGELTVRNPAQPDVRFSLAADKVNVSEWQQMSRSQEPKRASLSLVPEVHAQGQKQPSLLERTTGSGRLSVDTVLYDRLTLENLRSTVNLDHGIIRLAPVSAGLYGGEQVGTIVVNARTTPVSYTVESKLQRVDANELISAISSLDRTLYGLLAAQADARFVSTPAGADIARSLNGKVSLDLRDGKLAGIDLLHQLASIGEFRRVSRTVQPFTKLIRMTGDFDVKDGVATTRNLTAEIESGSVAANGNVDLVEQSINMHLTAVFSREYSQQVGGTAIGGFMTTALANRRGELVIPIIITGSLEKPSFAPDLQKIAKMKLENLLPTSGNPGDLTSGILGAVLGSGKESGSQTTLEGVLGAITGSSQQKQESEQKSPDGEAPTTQPSQAQPQPQEPQNVLRDILNQAFGEKKKKEEAPPPPQP